MQRFFFISCINAAAMALKFLEGTHIPEPFIIHAEHKSGKIDFTLNDLDRISHMTEQDFISQMPHSLAQSAIQTD